MTLMQRLISAGFAVAALASASVPALAWTVWPDVDFEWYADVGRSANTAEVLPAPREGYIWSPGHYERVGSRQQWVNGQWIKDDYAEQVALYSHHGAPMQATQETIIVPEGNMVTTGPATLRDRQGNTIPANPEAYPVDSDSSRR